MPDTMQKSKNSQALETELAEIIESMRKIQYDSHSAGQPMSQFELDRLKQLGERYGEVLTKMQSGG